MNSTRESVPATWSDTDEHFFRVVARLLPTDFLRGASTLLASYDPEPEPFEAPAVARDAAELLSRRLDTPSLARP